MKAKSICILLTLVLILSGFCSCAQTSAENASYENGATEDEANYPLPNRENFVESETETGMSYSFTLDRFTTEFNTIYLSLGGNIKDFPYKKWKQTIEGVEAANGRYYDYFYLDSGKNIVLTAVIETESRRVINLGCGVKVSYFMKNENNRQRVMTVCGIMAAAAGGYSVDDVPFFGNLYVDTIDGTEHEFWYQNSVYAYEEAVSNNSESTMLMRTMPASQSILTEWDLRDYKDYWLGK